MMNYVCEHCGAHLDPGEHCDCLDEKETTLRRIMDLLTLSDDGQFAMNFGGVINGEYIVAGK